MFEALKSLTTQLSAARTANDIGAAIFATAGRLGYETGLGLDVSKLFEIGEAVIFGDRSVALALNQERPLSEHPLLKYAHSRSDTFLKSDARKAMGVAEDDWWALFPHYLRGHEGIVVPIQSKGRLAWYVGFAGPDPDLSPAAMALVTCAAHTGFDRFQELVGRKANDSPLTQREAECLELVARGKSDVEIGDILNISARTVRFHIGNAKTKLGVTTRIQAVARQLGAA